MKHLILYRPSHLSSKDDHIVTSIKEIISQPSCTCRGLFQIYLPIYKESFQWKNIRYGEGMYRRSLLLCVCVCVCVCIQLLSWVWLFATPWTEACQAPLSMGFSRQKYWMGCHFLLQGIFLIQGSKLSLLHLLNWEMDSLAPAPQYDLQQTTETFRAYWSLDSSPLKRIR